jgi:hypothetical protein
VAQLENTAGQIIGFATQTGGARYFAFSTQSGDGNLYALVNNNGSDQLTNLGAVPSGMHRYRVEWTQIDGSRDGVNFYIDGRSVAQVQTNSGAANLNVYLVNNGGGTLRVDKAQVAPPYQTSGSLTSKTLDAGSGSTWQTVSWSASIPGGTSMSVAVRTSANGSTWSSWSNITSSGGAVKSPNRYMQLWISLSTTNSGVSPVLDWVNANKAGGAAPTATKAAPTATKAAPTATKVAPTATKPAPTATKAAPTATKPGPTATKPAPTATKPGPTATNPAPTQVPPTQVPPTQAPTQPPVAQNFTLNSKDDFDAYCAGEDHVQVSDLNQGSIILSPKVQDDFTQAGLDGAVWATGSLSGGAYNLSLIHISEPTRPY